MRTGRQIRPCCCSLVLSNSWLRLFGEGFFLTERCGPYQQYGSLVRGLLNRMHDLRGGCNTRYSLGAYVDPHSARPKLKGQRDEQVAIMAGGGLDLLLYSNRVTVTVTLLGRPRPASGAQCQGRPRKPSRKKMPFLPGFPQLTMPAMLDPA